MQALRLNGGPRLFAVQGVPSLLEEGCVLYLAEVLIRQNFFAEHEYQRRRVLHYRLVLATRAILEVQVLVRIPATKRKAGAGVLTLTYSSMPVCSCKQLHTGQITVEQFRSELSQTLDVPDRFAEGAFGRPCGSLRMVALNIHAFPAKYFSPCPPDMVRQSLREPTVAAAAILGFLLLIAEDANYTAATAAAAGGAGLESSPPQRSPVPPPRPFLEYVLSGNGLCLELMQRRDGTDSAAAATAAGAS